jgi:ABC-type nitrate/sulfonate/bicarbonate transport system permease component
VRSAADGADPRPVVEEAGPRPAGEEARPRPTAEKAGVRRAPGRARARDAAPALVLGLALLLVWQAATDLWAVQKWLLPSPLDVAGALVGDSGMLAWHALRTLQEALLGLALAFAVGVGTAVAMDRSGFARRAFYPVLVTSQTIPVVAVAPLLVIWFGYDLLPKVLVVALVCFFPIVVATFDGLGAVDPDAVRLVRSMGATGWQLFWRVRWPGALPGVFSGLRIGVTYGMVGAIVGEFVGAGRGLGFYLLSSADQWRTAHVFAGIVTSAAVSIALFLIVCLVQRLVVPWHRAER